MDFSASYIRLTLITAAAVILQAFAFPLAYGMESAPDSSKFGHRMGIDTRGAWLIPTNDFFRGENYLGHRLNSASSIHLKYAFTFPSWSREGLLHIKALELRAIHFSTTRKSAPLLPYMFFREQGLQTSDRNFHWTTSGISAFLMAGIRTMARSVRQELQTAQTGSMTRTLS